MFRALNLDGNITLGWLNQFEDVFYIVENKGGYLHIQRVKTKTIAMKTGQTDKNDKDIYGSFKLDGKMTKGGDVISYYDDYYHVCFTNGAWLCDNCRTEQIFMPDVQKTRCEIIGKQYEEQK